jgi:threonine synthase
MKLSGVNSINWGRIVAQIVYYFTAAVSLGAPHREVSFVVPTGNFGDIFAGYCARKMGLPIPPTRPNSRTRLKRATGIHAGACRRIWLNLLRASPEKFALPPSLTTGKPCRALSSKNLIIQGQRLAFGLGLSYL